MIEIVDHTGELEMRLTAPTRTALYAEALRGLAGEVAEGGGGGAERRPVELASSGPDTLLADLLNEAIFLMDVEGFLTTGLDVEHLGEGTLRGALVGRREPTLRPLAKAATYHGLVVRRAGEGWEGRVVLDV